MNMSIKEKILFLRKCASEYEATGKSKISDAEYDALYEEAKTEDPDNDFFDEVGGSLQESHIYGEKVVHKVTMGSLQKCPNIETSFKGWLILTYPSGKKLNFVVQHKIDGLSLGCIYKDGKLQTVVTRGDGDTGVDVTRNAKFVGGIPETIGCKDDVEVRGECYKDREDFYTNWVGEYENPRNFTSGAINQKDANVTKERGLDFIAYEVVRKDFDTEEDKIDFLKKNGFANLSSSTLIIKNGTHETVLSDVRSYMNNIQRDKLPYSIDGIVVKVNGTSIKNELGYVSSGKKPRANVAVKFPCEQVVTTIEDVEYAVGRIGSMSIVGLLKPVRLNETTVKRVSLHNFKFIEELGLKIGSEILLQKSGEIIPYVVRKVSDTKGATPIVIPTVCPSCNGKLEWDDTHTTKFCHNPNCPSQLVSKIDHWFKTIGVKGIGEGIITKLVEGKFVYSLADMYNLTRHKAKLGDLMGKTTTQNILLAIEAVNELTLAKFIEALGIGKIGTMSSRITDMAGTVEAIDDLKANDLLAIDGFAEIKANNFIDGWKAQREEITELLGFITIKEKKMKSGGLNGKSFCITGTLSKGRKEFIEMIEENGGRFSSSVNAKLDYLICGEECGSKKDKAEKLGIKIIEEKDFLKMIE